MTACGLLPELFEERTGDKMFFVGRQRSNDVYIPTWIILATMKHVPNVLSIARIAVTPLLVYMLFQNTLTGSLWALLLFLFGAISDYFDGRLARKYGVGTSFGQYLDPLADKVLVLGTFVALIFVSPEQVPVWAIAIIAVRDFAVTGLRSWAKHKGRVLRTSNAAKFKTTVQLTWLIMMLTFLAAAKIPGPFGEIFVGFLSTSFMYWLLVLVTLATAGTGLHYFSDYNQSGNDPSS
jgi:CDP-diacylglycerol--glycerol-3-phosphate 3-phosphatidyltransferase